MKATIRKNGLMMFTISVKFNFSRDSIVDVVREKILFEEVTPPAKRRHLLTLMRKAAHIHGYSYTFERGCEEDTGITREQWQAATDEAEKIVDKVFPELRTKQ